MNILYNIFVYNYRDLLEEYSMYEKMKISENFKSEKNTSKFFKYFKSSNASRPIQMLVEQLKINNCHQPEVDEAQSQCNYN